MIDIISLVSEIERLGAENEMLKSENDRLKKDLYVGEIKRNIFHQQQNKRQSQYEEVIDAFIREASHFVYYAKDLKWCVVPFHNLKDIQEAILSKKGLW